MNNKENLDGKIIAVIGLGYVGLPLATAFGVIREVIGFDTNPDRIRELSIGFDRTLEVSKEELKKAKKLFFTSDATHLSRANVFIVAVPTPVDSTKRPDLECLKSASKLVGHALKAGDFVIYESTVYPGVTEEVCVPILIRESGLLYITNERFDYLSDKGGFYCGYSPERINPGDKKHRLQDIKKVTSGSTVAAADAIDSLYKQIITAGTYKASSIKVAEAAKVIENAQRDINIAFVNELSIIFNHIEIDTREVLEAASTKWNFLNFQPGLVGGHCIGVDPYYLTHKAQEYAYYPEVILSGRKINDNMAEYIVNNTIRLMIKNRIDVTKAIIGILGVTFKENCPDIRNSKVFDIVKKLSDWGISVRLTDPLANAMEVEAECGQMLAVFKPGNNFSALIVAVQHDDFNGLTASYLRKLCMPDIRPVIIDIKALYNKIDLKAEGFEVFRL